MPDTNEPATPAPAKAPRRRRKLTRRRKIAFAGAAMLFGLLLTEGLLQILCLIFPGLHYAISDENVPSNIEDPVLGVRPNPAAPGHDSAGWRNPRRLDQADIVCIGDSQTYGTSCARDEAWPIVLGNKAGTASYSMAYGSYGPHQLTLTPEALELHPKLLLIGLYSGNDLTDCYRMVYYPERGQMPELRSEDPELLKRLQAADDSMRDFKDGWYKLQALVEPPGDNEPSFRNKLSVWCRLYGLYRSVRKRMNADEEAAKAKDPARLEDKWLKRRKLAEEAADPETLFIYDQGGVRTLLTPSTRSEIMNMDDPRIQEGMRLTDIAFSRILKLCGGKARLAVVFIPTKEYVFEPAARAAYGTLPKPMYKLAQDEAELWQRLRSMLEARGIACIDTLPALRGCVERGVNPYLEQWDGHPNAAGNEAMAELIANSEPVKSLGK